MHNEINFLINIVTYKILMRFRNFIDSIISAISVYRSRLYRTNLNVFRRRTPDSFRVAVIL